MRPASPVLSGDRLRGPPAPPRPVAYSGGQVQRVREQPAPRGVPHPSVRVWTQAPVLLQPAAAMAAAAAPRSLLVLLQVLGLALAQIVSPAAIPASRSGCGVWGLGSRTQESGEDSACPPPSTDTP